MDGSSRFGECRGGTGGGRGGIGDVDHVVNGALSLGPVGGRRGRSPGAYIELVNEAPMGGGEMWVCVVSATDVLEFCDPADLRLL